jgi:hypothetical protein
MPKFLSKWWKVEAPRLSRRTIKPRLEALETRDVPSTFGYNTSPVVGPMPMQMYQPMPSGGFSPAVPSPSPDPGAGTLLASTISLVSSETKTAFGDPVTFTATVAGGPGTPTGTVRFQDGGAIIGIETLVSGPGGAQAAFATSALSVGSHAITAVYSGDAVFAASVSAPVNVVGSGAFVTNLNDAGPGSLRAAITIANAGGGGPDIEFQSGLTGTINLETALPALNNIQITGPGSSGITVARDVAANTTFRIFTIAAGATSGISGLTITGGIADGIAAVNGGGILNQGNLWLQGDAIWNNEALNGGFGGGVANLASATLTVDNCWIMLNNAEAGGGISNSGFADIYGQTNIFSNGANYGGGIWNGQGATISVSGGADIYGNTAAVQGGGVYNLGSFTMNDGQLRDNAALTGTGGGLFNGQGASAALSRVSVTGNSSSTGGGGFALSAGSSLLLDSCIVSNNSAPVGAGIVFAPGASYTLLNSTVTDPIVQV